MWAPNSKNIFQVGSHVFTVEFHTYFYHLIDALPGSHFWLLHFAHIEDYQLPHIPTKTKGWETLQLEEIAVEVTKTDGSSKTYDHVSFPVVFGQVMDFYLEDTNPIFFPSYEYHTLSPNGVVLRHCVLQTNRGDTMHSFTVPALMLIKDLADIQRVTWRTSGGQTNYQADFMALMTPPFSPASGTMRKVASLGDVHARRNVNDITNGPLSLRLDSRALHTQHGVDLRPLSTGIMNQGDLGTCGVSAIASFLEFFVRERLSVLFLYWTSRVLVRKELPYDDSGVELQDVLTALREHGVCRVDAWPYDVTRFHERPSEEAFAEAARFKPVAFKPLASLAEMRDSLKHERPFFVDVFFSPMSYGRHTSDTGEVPMPPTEVWDESCEHTCLVMGYDDSRQVLIFQNTWGTSWGAGGYGFLPYEYLKRGLFRNAYTWSGDSPVLNAFVEA